MLKLDQLARVLRFQEAMGLTGVHYHGHGSEPSDPAAQAAFHARRLGLHKDDPAAARAGTNGLVQAYLAREEMNKAASPADPRDVILTREFWMTPPVVLQKPGMK